MAPQDRERADGRLNSQQDSDRAATHRLRRAEYAQNFEMQRGMWRYQESLLATQLVLTGGTIPVYQRF